MHTKIKILLTTASIGLSLFLFACLPAKDTNAPVTNINILIVLAHPDDETWMNGSIAFYLHSGFELHFVYAASGNRGSDNSGHNLTGELLVKRRREELHNALLSLGMNIEKQKSNVEFFTYDDGSLTDNKQQLSQLILQKILYINPAKVFTFGPSGITGHSDHIAVGQATSIAHLGAKSSSQLLYISMGQQRALQLKTALKQFGVDKYRVSEVQDSKSILQVDVSRYQRQRISSPEEHKSQFPQAVLNGWKAFVVHTPYEEFIIAD